MNIYSSCPILHIRHIFGHLLYVLWFDANFWQLYKVN